MLKYKLSHKEWYIDVNNKIPHNNVRDDEKQANISCVKCLIYMRYNSNFIIFSCSMVERLLIEIWVN